MLCFVVGLYRNKKVTFSENPSITASNYYINAVSNTNTYTYVYACTRCNAQKGQHEPCKGECCPVWVLQQEIPTWQDYIG